MAQKTHSLSIDYDDSESSILSKVDDDTTVSIQPPQLYPPSDNSTDNSTTTATAKATSTLR